MSETTRGNPRPLGDQNGTTAPGHMSAQQIPSTVQTNKPRHSKKQDTIKIKPEPVADSDEEARPSRKMGSQQPTSSLPPSRSVADEDDSGTDEDEGGAGEDEGGLQKGSKGGKKTVSRARNGLRNPKEKAKHRRRHSRELPERIAARNAAILKLALNEVPLLEKPQDADAGCQALFQVHNMQAWLAQVLGHSDKAVALFKDEYKKPLSSKKFEFKRGQAIKDVETYRTIIAELITKAGYRVPKLLNLQYDKATEQIPMVPVEKFYLFEPETPQPVQVKSENGEGRMAAGSTIPESNVEAGNKRAREDEVKLQATKEAKKPQVSDSGDATPGGLSRFVAVTNGIMTGTDGPSASKKQKLVGKFNPEEFQEWLAMGNKAMKELEKSKIYADRGINFIRQTMQAFSDTLYESSGASRGGGAESAAPLQHAQGAQRDGVEEETADVATDSVTQEGNGQSEEKPAKPVQSTVKHTQEPVATSSALPGLGDYSDDDDDDEGEGTGTNTHAANHSNDGGFDAQSYDANAFNEDGFDIRGRDVNGFDAEHYL